MKLAPSQLTLPLESLVLVTGASGFIATHIVDQLLLAGYRVRGTVRQKDQIVWTTALFSERHGPGKFTAVIVPEMAVSGAFDEAVKGIIPNMFIGYGTSTLTRVQEFKGSFTQLQLSTLVLIQI
jgi:NAD(P)-dependent dehydrogenase (short-subunit alcohol dehydrogenase family)